MIIITTFFCVANPLLYKVTMSLVENDESLNQILEGTVDTLDSENVSLGFSAYGNAKWYDFNYDLAIVDFVQENIVGTFILLFIAIFAIIFVNGEQKSGYVKSILGHVGLF